MLKYCALDPCQEFFAKLDTSAEVMGRLAPLGRILKAVPASLEQARALKRRRSSGVGP